MRSFCAVKINFDLTRYNNSWFVHTHTHPNTANMISFNLITAEKVSATLCRNYAGSAAAAAATANDENSLYKWIRCCERAPAILMVVVVIPLKCHHNSCNSQLLGKIYVQQFSNSRISDAAARCDANIPKLQCRDAEQNAICRLKILSNFHRRHRFASHIVWAKKTKLRQMLNQGQYIFQ